jgi:hypothetical protein
MVFADDANGNAASVAVDYVGPIEHHAVVVNGYAVPFLTATPMPGGRIYLTLDERVAIELPLADAERIVPFIADCIAISLGYTGHPGTDGAPEPRPRHPFARMTGLMID